MKPVLIVEGIRKNVVSVDWFKGEVNKVMVDNGDSFEHYNLAESNNVELVWENRYEPISEAVRKRINAYEERQLEIAVECMEQDIPKQERKELKREYNGLDIHVEGLTESLGIIREVETGSTLNEQMGRFMDGVLSLFGSVVSSTGEE